MATVSDILAISLNIDTSGVNQGAQAATQGVARVAQRIQQQAGEMERRVADIVGSVLVGLRNVAGFLGVALSVEGVRRMVEGFAESGTALQRFSEAAGVSVRSVSELEQALARAGGNAGDVRSVLGQMQSEITQARMGGSVPQWMQYAGLAPLRMGVNEITNRSADVVLLDLAHRAQAAHLTPYQLKALLPGLNLSSETLAVLTEPGRLDKLLKDVKEGKTGVTKEQAEAADRLLNQFRTVEQTAESVLRQLVVLAEPIVTDVIGWMQRTLEWAGRFEATLLGETYAPSSRSGGAPSVTGGVNVRTGSGSTSTPSPGSLLRTSPPPGGVAPSPVTGAPPSTPPGSVGAVGGGPPAAFVFHHTGGRGDVQGVENTLRQRGLGVEYVMDRDGNITQIGGPGSSHMMTGWGAGRGLSNRNTVGMEVIARDDKDVTPAQVEAARRFIRERYPNTPVFGHGEVNPGHKEASEGMSIVSAIRSDRSAGGGSLLATGGVRGSTFSDIITASGRSARTTEGIAIPSGGRMGDLYVVTTPDGRKFVTQLIDRGPANWTGRGVDISEALARKMGYDPRKFPTDSMFRVEPYDPKRMPTIPSTATGAGAALQTPQPINRTHESTAVINHVTVHSNATDAGGMASDVRDEIARQLTMPVTTAPATP